MKQPRRIVNLSEECKAARDRQKSYADVRRKPLEFQVGDRVMLKVSPWKGVVRFGKRGKLNPRVHSTFHVSNLKKCLSDEPLAVLLDEIHIDDKLHFVKENSGNLEFTSGPRKEQFRAKYRTSHQNTPSKKVLQSEPWGKASPNGWRL
ncbi:hypothetical protein Tco_0000737 [Tanacetum coccineum]